MMKKKIYESKLFGLIFLSVICATLFSCTTVNPKRVEMPEVKPAIKTTSFTESLADLGRMTEIYATDPFNIQVKAVFDDTGTGGLTDGEIPREISEMIKTTLNAVGGNVRYIPFHPGYMQAMYKTGYSSFKGKIKPDVVVTGGITEFDRGLDTKMDGIEFGVETKPFSNAPDWSPGNRVEAEYGATDLSALSRITLDFNLLDFIKNAGVSRAHTVNTVEVRKAQARSEFGFTLFGPTFGMNGEIKRVQGRHHAVRLLVQLSMIQMVGRYLLIPYWKLLPGGNPDEIVGRGLRDLYDSMPEGEKVKKIQELLYVIGYDDIYPTGVLDEETSQAIRRISGDTILSADAFVKIHYAVPLSERALQRRKLFAKRIKGKPDTQSEFLSLQTAFLYRSGGGGPVKRIKTGSVLHSGDSYKIQFIPEQDCYVYVFQADSTGQFFQLFPMASFGNVRVDNFNPVRKGVTYTIPSSTQSFVLDRRQGTEKIYLIASKKQFRELENLYGEIQPNDPCLEAIKNREKVSSSGSGQAVDVNWEDTGDVFTVVSQRISKLCSDCVHIVEFQHR